MIVINETLFYKISVNTDKNRVYLILRNFWKNADSVKNYLIDWQAAIKIIHPNFTVITDCRDMKTFPADVVKIHQQAQELLIKSGLLKVVDLLGDSAFTEFQTDKIVSQTGMNRVVFKDMEQAEIYLDGLHKQIA